MAPLRDSGEEGRRLADQLLTRFGGLARHLCSGEDWSVPIGTIALTGEVDFVIQVEQACTVAEVLRHLGADKGVKVSDDERAKIAERLRLHRVVA
jgi:hypothetical protein